MLAARDVGLTLGSARVLAGVSMEVRAQDSVAVMGQSGSGKTSLLYCLSGFVRPSEGAVFFNDTNLGSLHPEELNVLRRKHFGFVFQRSDLVSELTLRENVALPLRLLGRPAREAVQVADETLAQLGLRDHADRRPAQVSGGQQQRAAVARAIVHSPSVVFADEPTGNLDSANGQEVLEALLQLTTQHGSALVLVTHDPEIGRQAQRVVELHDGQLSP